MKGKDRTRDGREGRRRDSGGGGNALNVGALLSSSQNTGVLSTPF